MGTAQPAFHGTGRQDGPQEGKPSLGFSGQATSSTLGSNLHKDLYGKVA